MGKAAVIGGRVKRLRENLGWDQYTLAQRSGVSQGHISSIERGTTQSVGIEKLMHLVRALQTNVEYLIGASNDPRPHPRSVFEELTQDQAELVDNYDNVPDPFKELLRDVARRLRQFKPGEPPPDPLFWPDGDTPGAQAGQSGARADER